MKTVDIAEYQISGPEVERANKMLAAFNAVLAKNFGQRSRGVMTAILASQLASELADPDRRACAVVVVNSWLRIVAGGAFELAEVAEGSREDGYTGRI